MILLNNNALPIFTDNENINLGMLNRSGLDLNENGTNANEFMFLLFLWIFQRPLAH